MPRHSLRCVAIVALCLLAAACTTPFRPPQFEPDAGFSGIAAPPGTAQAESRVVWVHGMCHHTTQWIDERVEGIGKLTGATSQLVDVVYVPAEPGAAGPAIQVHSYRFTGGGLSHVFSFVLWSELTLAAKQRLCYDSRERDDVREVCAGVEGWPSLHERAALNDLLKSRIMNSCLADALIYSGATHARIRDRMAVAVCVALSGLPRSGSRERQGPPPACYDGDPSDWVPSDAPIAFVTESLGSKILFDALRHSAAPGRARGAAAARAGLQRALDPTRQMFLLANQIPILELAEEDVLLPASRTRSAAGTTPQVLDEVVDLVRGGRGPGPRDSQGRRAPLEIIAFTDPNDVLSYRLRPGRFVQGENVVRLVNVYTSNADTWFGLVERPDHAHTGYRESRQVIDLILRGREGPR
jgi:hypothetical protein